jgi:N-acetylglutamate synthase-like GNAT family acetyltransferase
VTVRSAELADVEGLARLFRELGYPTAADGLLVRLKTMLADPRADVLVAEDRGTLLGLATIFFVPVAHESAPWCRITTLVVDEARRGHGVGRMLVEAAESAAREAACSRIEVTSALHRSDAHRFYDSLGYRRTSAHFLKRLPARRSF